MHLSRPGTLQLFPVAILLWVCACAWCKVLHAPLRCWCGPHTWQVVCVCRRQEQQCRAGKGAALDVRPGKRKCCMITTVCVRAGPGGKRGAKGHTYMHIERPSAARRRSDLISWHPSRHQGSSLPCMRRNTCSSRTQDAHCVESPTQGLGCGRSRQADTDERRQRYRGGYDDDQQVAAGCEARIPADGLCTAHRCQDDDHRVMKIMAGTYGVVWTRVFGRLFVLQVS